MPAEPLKQIKQDTWLHSGGGPARGGVCYYMCNFIESNGGPWNSPGSFDGAVEAAQNFGTGVAMMNYAKAQNLRKAPQRQYSRVDGALATNRIYRAGLWVGDLGTAVGEPNHEIIIVTGNNNEIVYFEPNFGFFKASHDNCNNREALEYCINQQYGLAKPPMHAARFEYQDVRSNSAATPKGFDSQQPV